MPSADIVCVRDRTKNLLTHHDPTAKPKRANQNKINLLGIYGENVAVIFN